MTFERSELLALAPLLVLIVSLGVTAQWRRATRLFDAYGGGTAARRLAPRDLRAFPVTRLLCLLLACLALTVAAAGPMAPFEEPESDQPIDLVVALDLSLSMSAEDVGSSRAERARRILSELTDALPDERIGVAVFADWPYTLVPLTHDLDVVRFFGATLSPELVADRDQGTGLGAVVTHARATLERRKREESEPAILLLSDGESHGADASVLDSVAAATEGGVRLWTGGLGTTAGATLTRPGSGGEPVIDESGAPVVARLDESLLRQMADAGGGSYYDLSRDGGVRSLLDEMIGEAREPASTDRWAQTAFWLTLLVLPLLLWEGTTDSPHRLISRRSREETP